MTREALIPEGGWSSAPCDNCGDPVRIDPRIDQMDPRPGVYCAICYPLPLLPDSVSPEDFA